MVILLTMVGSAWPVFHYEGSALGKNLERRELVDSVADAEVVAAMEAQLYGETPPAKAAAPRDASASIEMLRRLDRILVVLCLALAASLPFLCRWRRGVAWLYLLPAAWLLFNAWAVAGNGGKAHAELSIPAHATRWMLPIVLALLIARPGSSRPLANWLLRAACALTFAVHGWEALRLHPGFQDLIYVTGARFGIEVAPVACHGLLHAIGLMDFLLALGVLLIHSPMALRWMAFWGVLTALSRPLSIGWDAWPELAIRLANGACPWLILIIGMPAMLRRRPRPEKIPAENPVSPNS